MKLLRLFFLASFAAFAVIQFVPVDRTNPPVESDIIVSPEIRIILRKACYDCHSHETIWPWYSNVAPVSWLVASDVQEGREELNFSTWARYDNKQQIKKLKKSWEEINEGEMPPSTYLLTHKEAVLSPSDKDLLHKWVLDLTAK